jgi:hypothetical protein
MQLDSDGGDFFPPPAGVVAPPNADESASSHEATANQEREGPEASTEGVSGTQD